VVSLGAIETYGETFSTKAVHTKCVGLRTRECVNGNICRQFAGGSSPIQSVNGCGERTNNDSLTIQTLPLRNKRDGTLI
jgi:hypothetical protein